MINDSFRITLSTDGLLAEPSNNVTTGLDECIKSLSQEAGSLSKLGMVQYYPFIGWRPKDKTYCYVFTKEGQLVGNSNIQKIFEIKGNWTVMGCDTCTVQRLERTEEWLLGSSA